MQWRIVFTRHLIFVFVTTLAFQLAAQHLPAVTEKRTDSIQVIGLGTGTAFKFKGLAIDQQAQHAFLGSWDKKEIVRVSFLTGEHQILKTQYSGQLNGMDCYFRNGLVYALMNDVNDDPRSHPISVLLVFEASSGELRKSYELPGVNGRNHFNHVVVDSKGIVYISNTLKSCIHIVDTRDDTSQVGTLIVHPDLSWVHGIDLSADETKLFTTSYEAGIRIFDLRSKAFFRFTNKALAGDDGLKYYKGSLYGAGQNSIKRYLLNKSETSIVEIDTLLKDHSKFNDPRCLHVENDVLYCLSNIEFDPVVFRHQKSSSLKASLTDTYILKIRLY
jgi:WD40 repeat protein